MQLSSGSTSVRIANHQQRKTTWQKKYRVGIIGCGSIANYHMQGWNGVDQVEVVALADPVAVAREEFGQRAWDRSTL